MDAQDVVLILNALSSGGYLFAFTVGGVIITGMWLAARYQYQKLKDRSEIIQQMIAKDRPICEIEQAIKMHNS